MRVEIVRHICAILMVWQSYDTDRSFVTEFIYIEILAYDEFSFLYSFIVVSTAAFVQDQQIIFGNLCGLNLYYLFSDAIDYLCGMHSEKLVGLA